MTGSSGSVRRLAAAVALATACSASESPPGVEAPGAGMRVSARAEDGLIEAIEDEGQQFCVGVQWHPEKLAGIHRDGLFDAFVTACG